MKPDETGRARFGFREEPDLRKEYRPIGIGAVAAALCVTAKKQENVAEDNVAEDRAARADNRSAGNDGDRYDAPLAA